VPLLINARKKLYKHDKDSDICGKVSETICNFSILRKYFPDALVETIDMKIAVSDEKREFARELIGFQDSEKILTIAPGANSAGKIWPQENFVELIKKIKHNFDKVIVVGSQKEYDVCNAIAKEIGAQNIAGNTTLRESVAVFELCSFFVGNDSGLGHIAAASGVKCFIIFAHVDISYSDPIRYTPYKQSSIFRHSNDEPMITVKVALGKLESLLK
jgi:ADP-heptose:LPS heptosyltransferase